MVRPKKIIHDPILKDWLTEFRSAGTQRVYLSALRNFKEILGIQDLGEYLKSEPDTTAGIRKYLVSMEGKPSKTIDTYVGAVRTFLQDHSVEVDRNDWRKLKRRGFMPKRVRAETRDKKPTKTQLKQILNYADIKARAMILFLVSSGARIGETLQLLIEDLDLDAEPPRVHIRREITKGGMGERTVYFSYEARDAIKDWLRIKDNMGKRNRGTYEDPRMFPWVHSTAVFMWNMACDKAGIGTKDKRTGRRIYHIHSLRKFFRTKIGLDLDVTHALMGHVEYLDAAYLRQDGEEIAKAYLEAMPNVSVYTVENQGLKQETEAVIKQLQTELNQMKKRYETMTQQYELLSKKLSVDYSNYSVDPEFMEEIRKMVEKEVKKENGR